MQNRNTGLIRLAVGFLLMFGSVGGMEHQPEASLVLQLIIAALGAGLCYWAVRDINRNTDNTVNSLKGIK